MPDLTLRSSGNERDVFTKHLETHLTARIDLEFLISNVLQALSKNPHKITADQEDIVSELNAVLTDYVTNSQLVVIPSTQKLIPKAMSKIEEIAIDNAVGISYISNVVSGLPQSTVAFSILLYLFADRLQIENSLLKELRANHKKDRSGDLHPSALSSSLYSNAVPKNEFYRRPGYT